MKNKEAKIVYKSSQTGALALYGFFDTIEEANAELRVFRTRAFENGCQDLARSAEVVKL